MDIRARLIEQADYMETDTPIVIETDSLVWHQAIALLREAAAALPTGPTNATEPYTLKDTGLARPMAALPTGSPQAEVKQAELEDECNRRIVAEDRLRMMTENALSLQKALASRPTGSPQADALTEGDINEILDSLDASPRLNAEQHRALWLKVNRLASRLPTGSETGEVLKNGFVRCPDCGETHPKPVGTFCTRRRPTGSETPPMDQSIRDVIADHSVALEFLRDFAADPCDCGDCPNCRVRKWLYTERKTEAGSETPPVKPYFVCPACGPRVGVDEDRCCTMCGEDCTVAEAGSETPAPPPVGYRAPITSAPYCLACIRQHRPWKDTYDPAPVYDTHETCINCGASLRAAAPAPEPER